MRGWVPFVTAAPIWGLWWLTLLPLLFGIAVAYKATKSRTPRRMLIEATRLALTLLLVLVVGGFALGVLVEWLV